MTRRRSKKEFTVVWEFRIKRGKQPAFERMYGPEGEWAQLFRGSAEYLGTRLIRDRNTPLRYLTFDHWTSRRAYLRFKKENHEAYQTLDKKCESLTTREKLIGEFENIESQEVLMHSAFAERGNPRSGADTPARASSNQHTTGGQECPPHTSTAQIRPAKPGDIPAIVALERDSSSAAHWPEPTYRRIFSESPPTRLAFAVADHSSVLYGFVIARQTGEDCELENIVVARKRQGSGVGTMLMRELIMGAKAQSAARIFLEVRESNAAARALYEKCGFALTGRRRGYYTNPAEDAVLYTLQL